MFFSCPHIYVNKSDSARRSVNILNATLKMRQYSKDEQKLKATLYKSPTTPNHKSKLVRKRHNPNA